MNTIPSEQPNGRPAGVDEREFRYIVDITKKYSAIALDDTKQYLVNSRLLPVARREGFASVAEFVGHLRCRPFGRLHRSAVEALATTETSFFRDVHPFEALRNHVIPTLIRRRQRTTRNLCIWSAACASGQEPYSLAMLLHDSFPMLRDWRVQLLASDLSTEMVSRAQEGGYFQHEINRGLPARLLVKYFRQFGTKWRVSDNVRNMIKFFQQNVTHDWYNVPAVDILLLRNALIYFDIETRKQVLRRVSRLLRPDGYLLLGTAETTLNLDAGFERIQFGRSVFYQISKDGMK